MAKITEEQVMKALSHVIEPELFKDIVTLNMVKEVQVDGNNVSFTVVLTTPACPLKDEITHRAEKALRQHVPEVGKIDVNYTANVTAGKSQVKENFIPGVKNTIAISSGKGGSANRPSASIWRWPWRRPAPGWD
ncbi:MAG: iron-sulfur cluster assembly protein [Candidatus Manganitrophus sp.]|nr:iron-sulfur cluster assembly protein [Candidatus Manganitrophus sp.]WDT69403.1 MAG: iron-sulfur cluster assembly protein [Candidatus Manganitrophus sp.]WDT79010.1 MAG: iron-sulfur cluster assembly protein [Candidatus Manganitrophus sp.]